MANRNKILVVDDTAVIRLTISKQLESKGLQVLTAENGRDALEMLCTHHASLAVIFLDIKMPILEGVPFLKIKNQKAVFDPIHVIMLTSITERKIIVECLKNGARDFIIKPFSSAVILNKVRKYLDLSVFGKVVADVPLQTHVEKVVFAPSLQSPKEKAEFLIQKINTLRALPFSVVKLINLCSDVNVSVKELAKPAKSDPSISAILLRVANSAAYASADKITDIQQAMARIGNMETRNIVMAMSVFDLFDRNESTSGFSKINIWVHSLITAVCIDKISTLIKHSLSDDAFMCGILHDLGKTILDDFLQDDYQNAVDFSFTERKPAKTGEIHIFDMDHGTFGSKVMEQWRIPNHIVQAIGDHHHCEKLQESQREPPLCALICCANHMAKALVSSDRMNNLICPDELIAWQVPVFQGIDWFSAAKNICNEVSGYLSYLNIPSDHINTEMLTIVDSDLKAALFFPDSSDMFILLQITLVRFGIRSEIFGDVDSLLEKINNMAFTIADLSAKTKEQVLELQSRITGECLVMHTSDELKSSIRLPLDFRELNQKINEFLKRDD